jgi:hypothetical protein
MLEVLLIAMLVVVLVVMLFILPPPHGIVKDIHNGALNECLGIVYIPINVLRSCGIFTSLRLPLSEYLAILAKSPPNKIPAKFHLLRKFPQNSICSGLGLDSKLVRNSAMCLVIYYMAPYTHKAEIPLVSMDNAKSCCEQF